MIRNKIVRFILSATFLALIPWLSSCDNNLIYENEGDCSVRVQFIYTSNRQALQTRDGVGADAFANTVESVHLFVFNDETGELVFQKTESTSSLNGDRNIMPVPLPNGTYTFIAWCGLDSNDENNAFKLNHNYTRADGNHCIVKKLADGNPVHSEKYEAVYHGVTRNVAITNKTINDIVPIRLTKNTNDIAVWIQNPEAHFQEGDYTVSYEDANGTVHFSDNSPLDENLKLTYSPHSTTILTTSSEYNGEEMEAGAMIAHLSVARLLASHKDSARMVVRDRSGKEVFSIPFLKYLMEMQTYTDRTGQHPVKTEQWYLDCEDTFNCSFYITGDQGKWTANRIIINGWVMVPQQGSDL